MAFHVWEVGQRITAARLNSVGYALRGTGSAIEDLTLINGSTLNMAACAVTGGFKPPAAAGAAPTTEGVLAFDSTDDVPVWGDGTNTRKGVSTNQTQTLSNKTLDASCIITAGGVSPSSADFWILS